MMKRIVALMCTMCLLLTSVLMVSAVVTVTNDSVAPGNYLTNGTIEDTTTHGVWSSATATTAAAYSGSYSLAAAHGAKRGVQTITVPTGKTYIQSAYVRTQNTITSPNNTHYIGFYTEGAIAGIAGKRMGPTHEWAQITWVYTIPTTGGAEGTLTPGFFSNSPAYYADDVYLGQVALADPTVSGESAFWIPANSVAQKTYTVDYKNQVGTNDGLESAVVTWSLDDTYPGVSIDGSTGVLSVDETASTGIIGVVATVTPNVNDLPAKSATKNVTLKRLTPPVETNLYSNPGFEDGVVGWAAGDATLVETTDDYKSGSKSVKITTAAAINVALTQDITVESEKVYLFNGWFKDADSTSTTVQMKNVSGLDTFGTAVNAACNTSGWVQATQAYRATVDGTATLGIRVLGAGDSFYADDMYAGELMINDITISGGLEHTIKFAENNTTTYTATVLNQVGNSVGLTEQAVTWSLKTPYTGVSINASTGELTTVPTTASGTVTLVASCKADFSAQPVFTKEFDIALVKEPVTPEMVSQNMIANPGFENGTTGWGGITSISDTIYNEGSKSAQVTTANAATKTTQTVTLEPGAVYIASAKIYLDGTEVLQNKKVQVYGEVVDAEQRAKLEDDDQGFVWADVGANPGTWQQSVRWIDTTNFTAPSQFNLSTLTSDLTYYVDDFYFGRLVIDSFNITGADEIEIPSERTNTNVKYSVSLTNQCGTTNAIGTQRVIWSLSENYEGVSVDAATGTLTVTPAASTGDIKIKAICNPTFNADLLPEVSEEKTIRLTKASEGPAPQVRNLKILGTVSEGENLIIDYTFYQKENNADRSTYEWYKRTTVNGDYVLITDAVTGAPHTAATYTVGVGEADYSFIVKVTPKDDMGNVGTVVTSKPAVKPTAPTVENIKIVGAMYIGNTVMVSYDFVDPNGDPEGATTFRWLRGDSVDSLTAIEGATTDTYKLTEADMDKLIAVAITPVSTLEPYGTEEFVGNAQNGPKAPMAINVKIKGGVQVGNTVTASYDYSHPYDLQEKNTKFVWLLDGSEVSTKAAYAIPSNAKGKTLTLQVTAGCEFAPNYGETVSVSATVSGKDVSWGGGGGTSFKGGGISNNDTPIVTPSAPVVTSKFADVTTHWAKDAIENMADKGIVNGVGDQKFEPDRSVSRSEFIAMVIRLLGIDDAGDEQIFTDVTSSDWYYSVVQTASRAGLISGRGDGFDPIATISREEAAVVLINAYEKYKGEATAESLGFADKDSISSWAIAAVEKAVGVGLLKGDDTNTVRPAGVLTRAEAASILARLDVAFNGGAE